MITGPLWPSPDVHYYKLFPEHLGRLLHTDGFLNELSPIRQAENLQRLHPRVWSTSPKSFCFYQNKTSLTGIPS